jgi:hypothetical protein
MNTLICNERAELAADKIFKVKSPSDGALLTIWVDTDAKNLSIIKSEYKC